MLARMRFRACSEVALPAPKEKADLTHVRAFTKALKALNAVNKRAGLVLHHDDPVAMQLKRKDESKFKRFLAGLEEVLGCLGMCRKRTSPPLQTEGY